MARDISEGYTSLNRAGLKKYTVGDLKTIKANLETVLREIRSEQLDLDDQQAIKNKNMRMSRINQTMIVINSYAKRRRLPI